MRSTIKHLMLFFGQNDHRRPFFAYGPFFISFFVPHFSSHNFGVLFDDVAPVAHHACTFLSLFPPPPLLPSSPSLSTMSSRSLQKKTKTSATKRKGKRGGGAPGPVRTSPTNVGDNDE